MDDPIFILSDKAKAELPNLEQLNNKVWIEGDDTVAQIFKDAGYTVKDSNNFLSTIPQDNLQKLIESNGKWDGDIILSGYSLAGFSKALKNALELLDDGGKIAIFLWECQPSKYLDNVASYKVKHIINYYDDSLYKRWLGYSWVIYEKGYQGKRTQTLTERYGSRKEGIGI